MLARDRPCVVGLSLPCTLFCWLQALRKSKIDSKDWKNAVDVVKFAVRIVKIQMAECRLSFFEHPMGASSWNVTDLADLKMCKDAETVLLHMCALNLAARDEFGKGLVLKPTRIPTNMPCLVERLANPRTQHILRMSCAIQSWTQFLCTLRENTSKVFH